MKSSTVIGRKFSARLLHIYTFRGAVSYMGGVSRERRLFLRPKDLRFIDNTFYSYPEAQECRGITLSLENTIKYIIYGHIFRQSDI